MGAAIQTATLDTVLGYAARGWPVFPVYGIRGGACICKHKDKCSRSPGKHPMTPNGFLDATLDVDTIRRWFLEYRDCNWGVATGHALPEGGYLVVLDVDPRNGGDETLTRLESEHGEIPVTVTAISGGNGAHYLFRSLAQPASAAPWNGIEVKAVGGYIVVHPSVHMSGRRYEWDAARHPADTPLADLPAWVTDAGSGRARARPAALDCDAAETLLGHAFRLSGLLGDVLPQGRRIVRCPWENEHSSPSGPRDTSTVILPPTLESNLGGFKCLHGHCAARGWRDVLDALPAAAVSEARELCRPRRVSSAPPAAAPVAGETWRARLIYKKSGVDLERTAANVVTILRYDPRWSGKIRYDKFAGVVRVSDPPWEPDDAPTFATDQWSDADDVLLKTWMAREREYSLDMSKQDIRDAVTSVAHANAYHEVQDYLSSLEWDGEKRVEPVFSRYFGAEATEYVRAVGRCWLVSAVARVFEPGCYVDSLPVLEGEQGIGKSKGLKALCGAKWFSDSHLKIGDADGYASLRGKWIIEMAELSSVRGKELTKVRAFITAASDHYRASYGHRHETTLRECVFVGTTNETAYLEDVTGNRRYWPIACGDVDRDAITRDRDQIWAEAVALYRARTPHHLNTPELLALAADEQSHRLTTDPWDAIISDWLALQPASGVLTHEILLGPLRIEPGRITKNDEMRVADILRRLGYRRGAQVSENGGRVRRYVKRQC